MEQHLIKKELPFTSVKEEANLVEQGWSPPIEVEFNNPHRVTAAQIGAYSTDNLITMTCTYGADPNVVDVEMREVKDPELLEGPKDGSHER